MLFKGLLYLRYPSQCGSRRCCIFEELRTQLWDTSSKSCDRRIRVDETLTLTLGDAVLPVVFPKVVSSSLNQDRSITIVTDSDSLSNLFSPVGLNTAYIILNENHLTAPTSNQVGVYDQTFSTSFLRVSYDSISSTSFTVTLGLSMQMVRQFLLQTSLLC